MLWTLLGVLGNQSNVHELNQLLQVIESTDFTMVDSQNSLRYANTGFCPGRTAPGGDFIYYDPWARTKLSKSQYEAMRTRGRKQMLSGHPVGYDFDVFVDGWDGRDYSPPARDDGEAAPEAIQGVLLSVLGWRLKWLATQVNSKPISILRLKREVVMLVMPLLYRRP